jgi:hypothetical protein
MEVTLSGIVTLVNLLHITNTPEPMEVRLLGSVTLVRPLHTMNA